MDDGLKTRISNGEYKFINETIKSSLFDLFSENDLRNIGKILLFQNCTFEGYLEFEDIKREDLNFKFIECTFKSEIAIKTCHFETLGFIDTKSITTVTICSCTLDNLYFRNNDKTPIRGNVDITNNIVFENLKLDNLNHSDDEFSFSLSLKNEHSNIEHQNLKSTFKNSTFKNLELSSGFYGAETSFKKLEIENELRITDCKFKKAFFHEIVNLGKNCIFHDCKFYSYFGFEDNRNCENTNLTFKSCLFTSFPHFNRSHFNHLEIEHCTFDRKTSFDELEVKSIKLYQATFIQGAFFDDIKIRNLEDKNYFKNLSIPEAKELRRTLRTIKHELYKTENRIDYNRFRGYELQAYYKEINWKDNFKDKFILITAWFSTGFDHSWLRAMAFTLLSALMFYCSFLISEDYLNSFQVYKGNEFFSGYFRFLLVTDFYNPLIKQRVFLTEPLSWLIFILGKIFIAFGIYEMIQAFRKFKS
ncbi:hypothetical protein [Flavobacterium sp. MK4S-17]|uniref:hypothetical protein n=1 Tax=Flavobacterium sp. MK4S-17 TaxID=2543737 RepID=UPI00135876DD|nr:hypothetical protein [Flavobacterium sp. MK4S-17]